ncbi:hypothetical protein P879_09033 [Paragonimus westermani]|uniref:C2 domain-containing protein n=1 Tax=Paragonimus westermani TaxID=34504 RepID=A0A8T0DCA4_9TREM|nr:hypothetical protein P879_09033 [Paragonimus westermani]
MFPLRGLMFAMQQEFNVQLEDETGRSIKPYFGELNFSITLNEIPEANVSSDRRQFLLKQLKTDRQTVHHLPRMVPNPDTPTVQQLTYNSQYWAGSTVSLQNESIYDTVNNDYVDDPDEYDFPEDGHVYPNDTTFVQPSWPQCFFEGTKVGIFTSGITNQMQPITVTQISRWINSKTDAKLENTYSRARLIVTLLRAENLCGSVGSPLTTTNIQKSKLINSRGMEKALLGRPLSSDEGQIPSPVTHLRLGKTTHHSFIYPRSFNPSWHQEFEFKLRCGEHTYLAVKVIDTSTALQPVLFEAYLNLTMLLPDWTQCFTLKNNIPRQAGEVILLATLTGFSQPPDSISPNMSSGRVSQESTTSVDPREEIVPIPPANSQVSPELLEIIKSHYTLSRTFESREDVGWLYVYVITARELMSKDRNGKSDPYCIIRVLNRCAHTSTVYKTLNPTWNQAFVFPVTDIWTALQIFVMDEDKDSSEFLGRVSIPLIQLTTLRRRWYVLKDRNLDKRYKGEVFIETHLVYNPVRNRLNKRREQRKVNRTTFSLCLFYPTKLVL